MRSDSSSAWQHRSVHFLWRTERFPDRALRGAPEGSDWGSGRALLNGAMTLSARKVRVLGRGVRMESTEAAALPSGSCC